MIAIGLGCRSGACQEVITKVITEALARVGIAPETAELFTFEGKRCEKGLSAAAESLAMPLRFLSLEALRAEAGRVQTRSKAAQEAFGIPSVAEAAALAGCGMGGRLILPRIIGDGVTCAIAEGSGT